MGSVMTSVRADRIPKISSTFFQIAQFRIILQQLGSLIGLFRWVYFNQMVFIYHCNNKPLLHWIDLRYLWLLPWPFKLVVLQMVKKWPPCIALWIYVYSSGTSTPSLSMYSTYKFYLHALTCHLGSQNKEDKWTIWSAYLW